MQYIYIHITQRGKQLSNSDNNETVVITRESLATTFWENFERILRERSMSQRKFAETANMNEKTLSSMISRRQCPDIWFLALTKEILKYDCSQLLFHYNEKAFTKILTEKERDVLNMIRTGTRNEQNRKLDVITAFLRYANNSDDILCEAIADATPPSMGTLDNTTTKRKHRTKSKEPTPDDQTHESEQTAPAPLPVLPASQFVPPKPKRTKKTKPEDSDQYFLDFYRKLGDENDSS